MVVLFLASCSKKPIREEGPSAVNPPASGDSVNYTNGVFIINEGNFSRINASVTFINGKTDSVSQDIFKAANDRDLGDVAQSMKILGDKGFIVVNNSNRIEVVSLKNFKTITTISGFSSPRYLEFVDSTKAYVTNMQKNISVIDLKSMTVTKNISTPYWTETLLHYKQYMFVTCIGSFTETTANRKAQVYVIDTHTDSIVDSIPVGKEPVGITSDRKNKIWVLCTGGYDNYEAPTLKRVDPDLRVIEKSFTFPSRQNIPSRLCINPTGDTLYYIYDGVFQMPVNAATLPGSALIPSNGHLFYGLGVHPRTARVYVSDAVDYVQNGYAFECSSVNGQFIHTYQAGRIPGSFCFTPAAKK
jgi:YVTN family beta-propeller protein